MEDGAAERLGNTVRAEMARRRVSQTAMAIALGMSQAAVSRRLNGAVDFTVAELGRVAAVLGVPLAVLLAETSPESVPA